MIIIFCKLNENFGEEHIWFDMQEANFIYDKYNIKIVPIYHYFSAFGYKEPLLFLYSKSQTINIEEGKDTYYLKFNIGLYHNERLIIQSERPRYIYILLDKCSIEKKELVCKIDKSELEDIYLHDIILRVYYPPFARLMFLDETVDKIFINYQNLLK